jgi:hypothetical protein
VNKIHDVRMERDGRRSIGRVLRRAGFGLSISARRAAMTLGKTSPWYRMRSATQAAGARSSIESEVSWSGRMMARPNECPSLAIYVSSGSSALLVSSMRLRRRA